MHKKYKLTNPVDFTTPYVFLRIFKRDFLFRATALWGLLPSGTLINYQGPIKLTFAKSNFLIFKY